MIELLVAGVGSLVEWLWPNSIGGRWCPLIEWRGDPGRCRWCDAELSGRRTKWCSDECGSHFWRNHSFNTARDVARKRDGQRCVQCGRGHGADKLLRLLLRLVSGPGPALTWSYEDGWTLEEMEEARRRWDALPEVVAWDERQRTWWDRWNAAAEAAGWRAWWNVVLEVDHITPALGRHAATDCVHHLDNLQTLCRDCHVEVGAARRRDAVRRRTGVQLDFLVVDEVLQFAEEAS